jgi:hypothetical protein
MIRWIAREDRLVALVQPTDTPPHPVWRGSLTLLHVGVLRCLWKDYRCDKMVHA